MPDVTFRLATSADIDRVLEIVNAVPGEEAVKLMGSEKLALQYDEGLVRLDPIPNKSRITVLAQNGNHVVGVLQYQFGDAPHHSRVDVLKLLFKVLGPIGFVRRFPAIYSRTTVDIETPTDTLHLTNLHVEAAAQGQNVGSQLLAWAENEARRLGARKMTLTTIPTNLGGIRLYERFGFKTTKTVTSPSYEKHTGIPGRIFMEKDVAPEQAATGS
jgi:ribosomal protein S18 acetylase RimI-like enzyme